MSYKITEYTKEQAKKLGVTVKPSTNKNKKIDVFKGGEKIASVGGAGYADYPTHIKNCGKEFADERRRLYKIRHSYDLKKKNSPGWFANKLLW
jgi:hypothetical protein